MIRVEQNRDLRRSVRNTEVAAWGKVPIASVLDGYLIAPEASERSFVRARPCDTESDAVRFLANSAELLRNDVRSQHCIGPGQLAPSCCVERRERRKRGRRESPLEPLELATGRGEDEGELVESGIVPDQHHRVRGLRHEANALEQILGRGAIQATFQRHRRISPESRPKQLERLPGALSGRAEDDLRLDSEPDKVPSDPLRVPAAPRRKRPLSVGERWIGPAGLGVPQEIESAQFSAFAVLAQASVARERAERKRAKVGTAGGPTSGR